jgi:hypothetical protein
MAQTEPVPVQPLLPTLPLRGLVAFALLAAVGLIGVDITPSRYFPNLDHYIPRYILLAQSVGFGLSAVRSRKRTDRLLGIAVLIVGSSMVNYIALDCLRIIRR